MPEISGMIQQYLEGQIKTIDKTPVIQSKNITENGTYTAPSGVDGYSPITVNVPTPTPVIESKSITENGTYTAPSGVDGFNPVVVNVPSQEPNIQPKSIFENGTYNVPSGVDGFNPVVVDVPMKEEITLNATTNGTYTPSEGRVYNNVIVNVPLPQNAYLLKSVANLPQAIASFNDGEEMVIPSLKVAIEPQQEGSGDPSPSNVRPISGWNKANLTVADDVETPTVSNVYTIDLDGTRYGGTLDVVNGIMTVDRVAVDLGALEWTYQALSGNRNGFSVSISDLKEATSVSDLLSAISSCYKAVRYNDSWVNGIMSYFYPTGKTIIVINNDYTNATAFKTAMKGQKIVFELATPLTIQLTPTAVKSLLGSNNVWADTGDITDAEYFSKEE